MTTKFETKIIGRILDRLDKDGLNVALEYGIAVCAGKPMATAIHHMSLVYSFECANKDRNFLAIFEIEYHVVGNAPTFFVPEFPKRDIRDLAERDQAPFCAEAGNGLNLDEPSAGIDRNNSLSANDERCQADHKN